MLSRSTVRGNNLIVQWDQYTALKWGPWSPKFTFGGDMPPPSQRRCKLVNTWNEQRHTWCLYWLNCNLSQLDKKSLIKQEQTVHCHSPFLNMFVNMSRKEVFYIPYTKLSIWCHPWFSMVSCHISNSSIYHTWLLMGSVLMAYPGSLLFWYFSFTIQLIDVCLDSHCIHCQISRTSCGHFIVSVSIL